MNDERKQLVSWLNNAYAMERSLIKVLEHHAKDAADLPEVRERDELHIAETHRHAERIEECLRFLGESPSRAMGVMGGIMGLVQSMATGPFNDELIKNFLMDYAAESFEVGAYRSLISAADKLGLTEIARLLGENLLEDEAMALWLGERIPDITRRCLAHSVAA
ncbi:MAG TPA: ferritin-like domain-containing protein [Opitutaceae bacterium]|nr:ferritin-like domain-containing protein [Opitutaceae bacterium]